MLQGFLLCSQIQEFHKSGSCTGHGQPNVTRAMNCLEQQTHCTLFIRTNRGVQLTQKRNVVHSCRSRHFSDTNSRNRTKCAQWFEHGSISIGASETALNIYLLDILKPFH
ncbi:MAG: LysR family transcriptional regulator [Emergencia sp.]